MNIKQEKFIYARLKDYDKRLRTLEGFLNVHPSEEAAPDTDEPVRSLDRQDRQRGASQSLEEGSPRTPESVTRQGRNEEEKGAGSDRRP